VLPRSEVVGTSVDEQALAGDEVGPVGAEEEDGSHHVLHDLGSFDRPTRDDELVAECVGSPQFGVGIRSGEMVLTVIPSGPNSVARLRDKPSRADLLAT